MLRLGCLESSQTMELLHGIRYVKKLFCLMNPTRRGSYGLIERGTLISLKISPICSVPELAHDIFFKFLQQRPKNRDVMNVVHHLTMWQVFLVSTLLSAASTAASTTLLTQCTSHLHPVPTRLLNTSTNPSMSHSPEVPKSRI